MKKSAKIIVGILVFIVAGVAAFFLLFKPKTTTTNPTLGSTAGSSTVGELKTLSDKIAALEADLKNKVGTTQTVTNVTGATIHTGEGSPASTLGANKDLYYDSTNGYTFIKINGIWQYSATGIYDGWSDEYSTEDANFLRPASVGAVAQVRDLVYELIRQRTYPAITIFDGAGYDDTQGEAQIHIAPIGFETYGEEYILPVYKVINAAVSLTITLTGGSQVSTDIFAGQVFPNSLLIPLKVDSEWTYVNVAS